ncbi:hypothetical protein Tco_0605530 [Tanacetum coccineum]
MHSINTPRSDEERLEHQDDLTNFVPPTPHDSPLSRGHTLGSDEGRPNINELMLKKNCQKIRKESKCKELQGLKPVKIDTSREEFGYRRMRIQTGENLKTRPVFLKEELDAASASVPTSWCIYNTAEIKKHPPTTTTTAFEDEDLTIAQTLVKIGSEKAKVKGVDFRDVEESARSITILPTIDPKDKGKGIMQEPEKPPKNPIKLNS